MTTPGSAESACVLTERVEWEGGTTIQEWYCPVPDPGVPFVVVRQEWAADYAVRRIYEIKAAESAEVTGDDCEHCRNSYPPTTGGSDVCDCPCHKSSYFQRAVGFRGMRSSDS